MIGYSSVVLIRSDMNVLLRKDLEKVLEFSHSLVIRVLTEKQLINGLVDGLVGSILVFLWLFLMRNGSGAVFLLQVMELLVHVICYELE
jgi:hypothetical protein